MELLSRSWGMAVGAALVAAAVWGCSDGEGDQPGSDTEDWSTSTDVSGDADTTESNPEPTDGLSLALGRPADGGEGFEAYAEEDAEIELVHGFQGGYHIEPVLYLSGIEREGFEADVEYVVEERESGQQVNRTSEFQIGRFGLNEYEGGYLYHSPPVVFEVESPSEITGAEIRLEVSLDVVGGSSTTTTRIATIVDEDGV